MKRRGLQYGWNHPSFHVKTIHNLTQNCIKNSLPEEPKELAHDIFLHLKLACLPDMAWSSRLLAPFVGATRPRHEEP